MDFSTSPQGASVEMTCGRSCELGWYKNGWANMDFGPQQIGKWLVVTGIAVALLGVLILLLARIGLFKLPGDLEFGSGNWRVYIPIAGCVLISIVLTLILWVINYFRR